MKLKQGRKYRGLSERQERFIVEWSVSGNGKEAAIKAGYSKKTAAITACQLLKRADIQVILKNLRRRDERKARLTKTRVLRELARGLYRDPVGLENAQGLVVSSLRDIPRSLRVIIDSFKVMQQLDEEGRPISQRIEVKLVPKASVIDMAMKHVGAYAPDKHEVKAGLDWDSLYDRSTIVDPVQQALEEEK